MQRIAVDRDLQARFIAMGHRDPPEKLW